MSCPTTNCLCERLVLSQGITFADGTLTINIPEGSYSNGKKYCLVLVQEIPDTTTIAANVVITIGTDTTTYPLVNCNCTNVNVCQLESRRRYSVVVRTNVQSGVFKLTGKVGCNVCDHAAAALPIPATTPTPAAPEVTGA